MNNDGRASAQGQSRGLSAASLEAHTWLGLAISAAMYLICLSGTLAVFNLEFERWEQPAIAESTVINAAQAQSGLASFVGRYGDDSEHLHVVLPSSGIPRLVVENDDLAHFVNAEGGLGEVESSPWTSMLIDLHYYLHLPHTWGIVLVSTCGVLLLALILSGLFAHHQILRDAFRFRRGGSGTQQRIDLHNRLSVWGLPFHLMISVTGAYYGLFGVLAVVTAEAFYDGDLAALSATVFTPEPVGLGVERPPVPNVAAAIEHVLTEDPAGTPIFLTVHEPGTEDAFIEVYVQQPGRLIYAESYRYDTQGQFVGRGGYRDGAPGKQLVYSLYRLHFGDFAGRGTQWLYFALGMMLTVISVTGVNIWLSKRKHVTIINALWPAFVWAVPLGFSVAQLTTLLMGSGAVPAFWCALLLTLAIATGWPPERIASRLRIGLGLSVLILLSVYVGIHGDAVVNAAAWPVALALLMTVLALLLWEGWSHRRRIGAKVGAAATR